MKFTCTHKGWFGVCPIYIADPDDAMFVHPRHWTLAWLLWLSEGIYDVAFIACAVINPAFEPKWPIRISGELARPIVIASDE